MNEVLRNEMAGDMLGVAGRFMNVIGERGASVVRNQKFITETRPCKRYGEHAVIRAEVRFDDELNNGHNTFAITANIRDTRYRSHKGDIAGGCCHDDIAAAFPELAPLIPWHLTSSDGPMHYIANTVYNAGDRDHNGLRKGERRHAINGKTREKLWTLVAVNSEGVGLSATPTGDKYRNNETVPLFILQTSCSGETPRLATPVLRWEPQWIVGEGKERDLDAARACAVWPDASDSELSVEPDALKAALAKRHPLLMANFKQDMIAAGFMWTE
jgi:hypothetical protein